MSAKDLIKMASRPIVLCFSFSTPPNPAPEMVKDLFSEHYAENFTLVDEVSVTDLSENERENVRGILVAECPTLAMEKLGKETMDLLPNLKVISNTSTGINRIDVEAATARGIRVGHTPGHVLSDSVADFAIGLMLASACCIVRLNKMSPEVTKVRISLQLIKAIFTMGGGGGGGGGASIFPGYLSEPLPHYSQFFGQ